MTIATMEVFVKINLHRQTYYFIAEILILEMCEIEFILHRRTPYYISRVRDVTVSKQISSRPLFYALIDLRST